MSSVSSTQILTKLTAAAEEGDVVVSVDGEELRSLEEALKAISGTSHAAALLLGVIENALRNGRILVLGATEGLGGADEDELRARVLALVDGLVPQLEIPSEAATILARRNAKRRAELLQEFGALSGEQIAEERSRASNRHALAARWRKEGKLFGVPYRGQTLYPAFQFDDDGRLRPAISDVLAELPRDDMSDWEVAYWWTAANGWLGGSRPVDLLYSDPDSLVDAARRLGEPLPL
jgi:hypothetical protein